jgi:hypothetical protein
MMGGGVVVVVWGGRVETFFYNFYLFIFTGIMEKSGFISLETNMRFVWVEVEVVFHIHALKGKRKRGKKKKKKSIWYKAQSPNRFDVNLRCVAFFFFFVSFRFVSFRCIHSR